MGAGRRQGGGLLPSPRGRFTQSEGGCVPKEPNAWSVAFDLMLSALVRLSRRLRSTAGVCAAVTLGICGSLVIVVMGEDVKRAVNRDVVLLGGAVILKLVWTPDAKGTGGSAAEPRIAPHALEDVKLLPGVEDAARQWELHGVHMDVERRSRTSILLGVDAGYWEVNGLYASQGRLFGSGEVDLGAAVIGPKLGQALCGPDLCLGRTVELADGLVRVIGVVEGGVSQERQDYLFIPLASMQRRTEGLRARESVYVRAGSVAEIGEVESDLERLAPETDGGAYTVETPWTAVRQYQRVAGFVEAFSALASLAAIGLGGYGVWHGMTAAARSRTREIGLKKAMGAQDGDVLVEFLAEAVWLTSLSGFMGIVLAAPVMLVIGRLLGAPLSVELYVRWALFAFVCATCLGVVAGVGPAIKAARTEIAAALRHE